MKEAKRAMNFIHFELGCFSTYCDGRKENKLTTHICWFLILCCDKNSSHLIELLSNYFST